MTGSQVSAVEFVWRALLSECRVCLVRTVAGTKAAVVLGQDSEVLCCGAAASYPSALAIHRCTSFSLPEAAL